MSASIDGFVSDRNGDFGWSAPSAELFDFQLDFVGSLGVHLLGRRLYETMRVWEVDRSLRDTESGAAFAEVWSALPKVVFSSTLERVEGNARLARTSLSEEVAAAGALSKNVGIGGATLAGEALKLDLVDELRVLRNPIIVGGGTPLLPVVAHPLEFTLLETRAFGVAAAFERYQRAR